MTDIDDFDLDDLDLDARLAELGATAPPDEGMRQRARGELLTLAGAGPATDELASRRARRRRPVRAALAGVAAAAAVVAVTAVLPEDSGVVGRVVGPEPASAEVLLARVARAAAQTPVPDYPFRAQAEIRTEVPGRPAEILNCDQFLLSAEDTAGRCASTDPGVGAWTMIGSPTRDDEITSAADGDAALAALDAVVAATVADNTASGLPDTEASVTVEVLASALSSPRLLPGVRAALLARLASAPDLTAEEDAMSRRGARGTRFTASFGDGPTVGVLVDADGHLRELTRTGPAAEGITSTVWTMDRPESVDPLPGPIQQIREGLLAHGDDSERGLAVIPGGGGATYVCAAPLPEPVDGYVGVHCFRPGA